MCDRNFIKFHLKSWSPRTKYLKPEHPPVSTSFPQPVVLFRRKKLPSLNSYKLPTTLPTSALPTRILSLLFTTLSKYRPVGRPAGSVDDPRSTLHSGLPTGSLPRLESQGETRTQGPETKDPRKRKCTGKLSESQVSVRQLDPSTLFVFQEPRVQFSSTKRANHKRRSKIPMGTPVLNVPRPDKGR